MDVDFPIFSSDEEEKDAGTTFSTKTNEIQVMPRGAEHYQCIVDRKIALISEHPLTQIIAHTMVMFKGMIMELIYAASQFVVDDIDIEWLNERLGSLFSKEQREKIEHCERYLLELTQYAAIHAQAQYKSDCIRAKKFRQFRVDELDTFKSRHSDTLNLKNRKRLYEESDPKAEEVDDTEDAGEDPYVRRFSFGNAFALKRSPSPPPNETAEDEPAFVSQPTVLPSAELDESAHSDFTLNEEEQTQRVVVLNRRQQIRDQLSFHIGYVKPLGKKSGPEGQRLFDKEKRNENDRRDERIGDKPIKQRKKRTAKLKQNNTRDQRLRVEQTETECFQRAIAATPRTNLFDEAGQEPIVIASSSESITLISKQLIIRKSCLKKGKGKTKELRIQFSAGVDFEKRSDPGFHGSDILTRIFGQTRTDFIRPYEVDSSVNKSGKNCTLLPNCDTPIAPAIRKNPDMSSRKRIQELKDGITKELNNVIRRSFLKGSDCSDRMIVSRLLITDSMLSSLNIEIFRNMDLMCLNYPRMPIWLIDSLEDWFNDNTLQFHGGVFTYTKIFISLGLDTIFYYADPTGKEIDTVLNFLRQLFQWFEAKSMEIKRRAQRERRETGEQHTSMELSYEKPLKDDDYDLVWYYRITQIPTFVIITVPEIGGWKRYLCELNRHLRKFVIEESKSEFFELLDWAEMVKSKEPELVDTVAKRTALLVRELHTEHGVFYK